MCRKLHLVKILATVCRLEKIDIPPNMNDLTSTRWAEIPNSDPSVTWRSSPLTSGSCSENLYMVYLEVLTVHSNLVPGRLQVGAFN
jgi:hypothetical protein